MRAPFFVEILSRNMEVKHRYQRDSLPISIGRAYDNNIIIDDPHIAAHHAIVKQDCEDSLLISDLDSRNGIIIGGSRQSKSSIDSTTTFQLGQTLLRIRSADCNVDDEVLISSFHKWDGWPPALAGTTIMMLIFGFIIWIDDADKFEASSYLGYIAIVLLCGVTWCGIWALISRLFGGEHTRFGRHLFILGCGLTVIILVDYIFEIIAYSLSLDVITRYSSHIDIAMLSGVVFLHLLQISPNNIRRYCIICIVLAFLGSATTLLYNYRSDRILADQLFMHARYPGSMRIAPNKPISKFLDNAKLLKTKLSEDKADNEDDDSGDDDKAKD